MSFFLALAIRRPMLRGYFLKERKLCMQNLTKERKQLPVVIMQQSIFYKIFIRCLWLRIMGRSDQFMSFPSHIFFNDISHGYRATILKKSSASVLYGCRYLLLLWKGAQNDVHWNCIAPSQPIPSQFSLSIYPLKRLENLWFSDLFRGV